MAPPRLLRLLAEEGRWPAILVRRDGDGAAMPLTRPLFSRLILLEEDEPMLGIMDLRDLGILRRGGALPLLLTLPPPIDLVDDGIGGLAWTVPSV